MVGEEGEVPHRQKLVDRGLIIRSEDGVDVLDDGHNVGRAVFGHVLVDGLEVSPEIAVGVGYDRHQHVMADPKYVPR